MKLKRLKNEIMVSFVMGAVFIIICIELISFWWIRYDMQERSIDSTVISLTQLELNIESLMGNINDISKFTIANKDVRTWLKSEYGSENPQIAAVEQLSRINEAYSNLTNSKTFFASINIYGFNGQSFETAGSSYADNSEIEAKHLSQVPINGNLYFTDTYLRNYYTLGTIPIISVYQNLHDINNLTDEIGLLRLDISEIILNKQYKDLEMGKTGYIFISNKEGDILSHNDKSYLGQNIQEEGFEIGDITDESGYFLIQEDGKKDLLTYYKSNTLNMIFLSKIPYDELMSRINLTRNLTILLTLVSALVVSGIFYILSSRISTPINQLLKGMKEVESGNFDIKVTIDRDDEIGALSQGFNQMAEHLSSLIHENYIIQIKKKEAEIKALQSQINPHFLYNTLDIAYWSSRIEDAPNTEQILANLSTLFKLGLNSGKEFTTIGKEMEHLQSYINIQLLRFEDEPKINIDIDESICDIEILKLMIQPVVENSFLHGIDELEDEGMINITCFVEDETIIFEIYDNGKGMETSMANSLLCEESTNKGYGLRNVNERIQLYYGKNYGISIESELNLGTKVRIQIPKKI